MSTVINLEKLGRIPTYVTIGYTKDVRQIDPKFYDASFDILFC